MSNWLSKQKFFITGGLGALGNHLTKRLIELGATDIVVFDQQIKNSKTRELLSTPVRYIAGDILCKADIESELNNAQLCSI